MEIRVVIAKRRRKKHKGNKENLLEIPMQPPPQAALAHPKLIHWIHLSSKKSKLMHCSRTKTPMELY